LTQLWLTFLSLAAAIAQQPVPIQFAHSLRGRPITVIVDGRVERTFAGKMGFRDQNHEWSSVCADLRSPVSEGQTFIVRPLHSSKVGGRYARAGNIVAKYFNAAQTPEQCAGLQIAVWEALDGGNLTVTAEPAVLQYAHLYYLAASEPGDALLLATGAAAAERTPATTDALATTGQAQLTLPSSTATNGAQ
jgi:hypothetical protein